MMPAMGGASLSMLIFIWALTFVHFWLFARIAPTIVLVFSNRTLTSVFSLLCGGSLAFAFVLITRVCRARA